MEYDNVIKDCLDLFCWCSSPWVSEAKTKIFFSSNISTQQCSTISNVMGFQSTEDPGKYVGINIFYTKVHKSTFVRVIDRASNILYS